MYWNYLKIALRNLNKQKLYSLINILGLAMGLAIFSLFAVIAGFDTNADKFHKNAKKLYGVIQVLPSGNKGEEHTAFNPAPLLPALLSEFPEIEDGTSIFPAGRTILKYKEKIFFEDRILFVDPNFLTTFTFELSAGEPLTALANPYSIVLSKDVAFKYFGTEDPVGQILTFDNKVDVTVTGVLKFYDDNYSSLLFDFLVSMETARHLVEWMDDWNVNRLGAFVMLQENYDHTRLDEKIPGFINKYCSDSPDSPDRIYLLPFLDFRLKSNHITSYWSKNETFFQYFLFVSGVLILMIVCINFMSLSTARYMNRIKEVAMRKVSGAKRIQLIKQFLGESVIMALIALPISLLFYHFLTTGFIRYIVMYQGEFSVWDHPFLVRYLLGLTVVVGILAGSYPAFFISSFKPAGILKGEMQSGKERFLLRKILVVSQFALAIVFIVATMTWKKQIDHIGKADFGYDRNRIITVRITDETRDKLQLMKEGLSRYPDIVSVTATASLPGVWNTELQVLPEGVSINDTWTINVYDIDYGFLETMGINIEKGRNFSRLYNDSSNFIVNETMVRQLQWTEPVGKKLTIEGEMGTVIGVAKDAQFRSVIYQIAPTVFRLKPENLNYLIARFSSSSQSSVVVEHLREQWHIFTPNIPFESVTLNHYLSEIYRGDRIFITLFGFVDAVAIIVSCLGLFGLASYAVEKRRKEIGIRKAVGSSVSGIIRLLARDFLILVIIANVVALPLAYLITDSLFQLRITYSRVNIGVGILVLTACITIITAIIAVLSQTLKAAITNPVDSLRYE